MSKPNYLGLRFWYPNSITGGHVGVYDGEPEAQFDLAGGRWQTVCEVHGAICSHDTLKLARAHGREPQGWCEECMALLMLQHDGLGVIALPVGLETPVTFKTAVAKARKLVGPIGRHDLLDRGIVVQDLEHDGGNGKWYVNPSAINHATPGGAS